MASKVTRRFGGGSSPQNSASEVHHDSYAWSNGDGASVPPLIVDNQRSVADALPLTQMSQSRPRLRCTKTAERVYEFNRNGCTKTIGILAQLVFIGYLRSQPPASKSAAACARMGPLDQKPRRRLSSGYSSKLGHRAWILAPSRSGRVDPALGAYRRKFLALLSDPQVGTSLIQHRDRFS